jgi:hypothetical protein
MSGATHFIEVYKNEAGEVRNTSCFSIESMLYILGQTARFATFKTIAVWKIKALVKS